MLSVVFAASLAFDSQRALQQYQLIVYSLRNHTAVDLVSGGDHVLLCDEKLLGDPSSIDYSLKGSWAKRQLTMNPTCYTLQEEFEKGNAMKKGEMLSFHGVLLAFWDPSVAVDSCYHPIAVDCLVVREKQPPDLQRIGNSYHVGMLLIDGSVPKYLAQEWIRQAESMDIPCHDLKEGAFIMDL